MKNNIDPNTVNNLNRLTLVDDNAMGGLTYEPMQKFETLEPQLDLDKIAKECESILKTDQCDDLDEMFKLGGSSGGARPKILTKIDGEDWIIKFPSSSDDKNEGELEYKYSVCAKDCGLEISESRLFPSNICSGYFGTKRFDRVDNSKIHMVSVSGLLEKTHRLPNLDYNTLMKLTVKLTNSFEEVEKMFRLMCFNVFAHNRDDHSKNFAFLYVDGNWVLSPAYDLTKSYSINGEHATTINGEGKDPTIADIMSVAKNIGLKEKTAQEISKDVKYKVDQAKLLGAK